MKKELSNKVLLFGVGLVLSAVTASLILSGHDGIGATGEALSKTDAGHVRPIGGKAATDHPLRRSSPRNLPKQERNPSFPDLSPTEQSESLIRRLASLREDLTRSDDPGLIIKAMWSDIQSMDSFRRRGYWGSVESQLAELDPEADSKLEWIASILPAIKDELDQNMVFENTAKDHLFSLIGHHLERQLTDPYEEIMKLPEGESRSSLLVGVLPQYILLKGADYRYFEKQVPSDLRDEFLQNMMEVSATSESYRGQGLNIYLEGKGDDGEHPQLVYGWFGDNKWINHNVEEVWEIVSNAQPSPRRSLIAKSVLKNLEGGEVADRWESLIDH